MVFFIVVGIIVILGGSVLLQVLPNILIYMDEMDKYNKDLEKLQKEKKEEDNLDINL